MNLFELKRSYQSGTIGKQDYINAMFSQHQILFDYSKFVEDTDICKIEIQDGMLIFTSRTDGIKIASHISDKRLMPIEILNFGTYELVESNMMMELVSPTATVFDIGANIGWYSITIARRYPNSKIFAFEPIPNTFDSLQRNIHLNQINNITAYDFGFSNTESELKFYCDPDLCASASSANLSNRNDLKEITASVKRLDDFIQKHKASIDFLKCDVEGAELLVFQGGINAIGNFKPIVFSEMLRKWSAKFNYHPNDIIDLFSSIGYKCFTVKGNRLNHFTHMDDNTVEMNFFFLHRDRHQSQIERFVET
jgi:FkbM family methyltransferase